MKMELQQMVKPDVLARIEGRVENNASQLDDIVNTIIHPYCEDLDNYVSFIKDILQDGENQPTSQELQDFCMNLSVRIYYASAGCELLGVRDDMAKAVYEEMYNASRNSIQKGTVADKDSMAALNSQEEAIISSAYSRAYKTLKNKIASADKVLQICNKVLSFRMQEMELTRIQTN